MSVVTACNVMEIQTDKLFPVQPYAIGMYCVNLLVLLSAIISLQTSFIAVARCLCVSAPFYFKSIFNRRVVLAFMISIIVMSAAINSPVFAFQGISYRLDPLRNISRPSVWYSAQREYTKNWVWAILAVFVPLASQVIVFISLVVMVKSLKDSYRFRQTCSLQSTMMPKVDTVISKRKVETTGKVNKMSSKEIQIAQQVVLIAAVFIFCHVPKVMFIFTSIIVPEFNLDRAFNNLYQTMDLAEFVLNIPYTNEDALIAKQKKTIPLPKYEALSLQLQTDGRQILDGRQSSVGRQISDGRPVSVGRQTSDGRQLLDRRNLSKYD
ncbi:hypothetical protein Btru_018159 [Bulinus truncatus]|nr:hypothetical protein Btru_018159 [Bulinus truncatus]